MKKFNFAITDSTTYLGQDAIDFYSTAVLTFPSAKYFTVVPNVKNKIKLPSFNLGSILQADDSVWNATGEGTLAQKTFTVSPLKANLEFTNKTFEVDFLSQYMKAGSNQPEVTPAIFQNYMLSQIMAQVANDLEKITWAGVGSGSTYPVDLEQGLIAKMSQDSATIKQTATTITSANVIAELTKVYNLIPTAVLLNYNDVKFYVSSNIARAYRLAQAASGAGAGYNYAGEQKLNFVGFDIIECPGLGANQMVAASMKNMLLLTDLLSDFDEESALVIAPQLNTNAVPTVKIRLGFKFAVDYKVSSEVVIYS